MRRITTNSPDETEMAATIIAERLRAGDVVALRGSLGAGKTCFVRGLVGGRGFDRALVSSPTFVIAQEYAEDDVTCPIVHIDAYRIHHVDELQSAGLEDLWSPEVITVIEWPEQIEDSLPGHRIEIDIEHLDETRRELTLEIRGSGQLTARLTTVWGAA